MASLRCKRSGGCCQLDNCWTGVRMRSNCERVIVPSNGGGAGDVIGSDPSAPKSYQHLDYFRIGFRLRRRKDAFLWKVGRLRCSFIPFGSLVGFLERLPNWKRKAAILELGIKRHMGLPRYDL
ncbi:hypothetical protein OPV22_007093 [Ensete ventricosum]|uniref:Uncharacterized protein n=1 Tax=Ensete ventricosum TaxID=4639 RepID=A0AAV8RMT2_ENSVE|nr:hypothetical protein OPV22_007093 [Ensete ventricosum]